MLEVVTTHQHLSVLILNRDPIIMPLAHTILMLSGMPVLINYFSMNKKRLIILFFVVVIAGFVLAAMKQNYFTASRNSTLTVSVSPAIIFSGTIIDLQKDKFTFLVGGNMAANPELAERIIHLTPDIPVVLEKERRDPEIYATEMQSHMQTLRELSTLPDEEYSQKVAALVAPEQYILEPVSTQSLAPGMKLFVYTDHDVMEEKEFTITKIRILYKEQL